MRRTALALVCVLPWFAGCSDGPLAAPPADPCTAAPPIALGDTVRGTLAVDEDCLAAEGRLFDDFALALPEATLFTVTLSTEGYRPLMPLYRDSAQVSGWASDTRTELTREHFFPAGDYRLRSTTFERVNAPATPFGGTYVLSTARLAEPQVGCGRETSVTYGSVVSGTLTEGDCEAVRDVSDPVIRRSDGYDFLLRPGRRVRVTVTADFPYRFWFWANGQPVETFAEVPAGQTRTLTAGGIGFLDFYVLNEQPGGGGRYTLTFEEAPPEGG